MAITRAQQAKQMLREGGRIGFFTAGLARGENISPGTSSQGGSRETGYGRDDNEATRGAPPGRDVVTKPPVKNKYGDDTQERFDEYREEFINEPVKFPKYTPSYLKIFEGPLSKGKAVTRKFNIDKVAKAGRYQYTDPITGKTYTFNQDLALENPEIFEAANKQLLKDRNEGKVDAFGNPKTRFDDDSNDNQILFPQDIEDNTGGGGDSGDNADDEDDTNTGGLALRFRKDGGRINAMDGGMMSPEGGIMDLETGRQMYFLGKLVKKATRAVKKIAKSPIGKVALFAAPFAFSPAARGAVSGLFKDKFMPFMFEGGKFDLSKLTGKGAMAGIGALSALPFLFQGDEEEEDQTIDRGPGLDIAGIRNNPYNFLGRAFVADGGIMRAGYQEGSKEPVAKKTMPLLDMDGKEMDLRDDGGFVPLGRMERADDVPARLSKNEFVFTADAVRNAGEGDVDKGAEVMYNMMKNLESGGEVSEESQGLQGAREMFQTSKRLEEVL